MDNYRVELEDTVYDIMLGTGRVVSLNEDGSFLVAFGTQRMTYQKGGYFAGVKRLFWADPVLLVPPKRATKKWEAIQRMISLMDELM
ncbi:hypothetical protein V757_02925 [Pelistega indica]|uniref:Uncharacterized protein n=1 Tax=Pelistega indica TaxID=1414851 RepID=V8G972_9BURK|nr:hypothetical protein [Pelistega indica]ETD72661.1 hypothetical protein V757_02925 [Pelistega indica]